MKFVLRIKYYGGENERKFLKIHCGRVKNYLWERGIQLSNDSKGKERRTFRFMPESCNNEADQNSLLCQRIQKAVQGEITNK